MKNVVVNDGWHKSWEKFFIIIIIIILNRNIFDLQCCANLWCATVMHSIKYIQSFLKNYFSLMFPIKGFIFSDTDNIFPPLKKKILIHLVAPDTGKASFKAHWYLLFIESTQKSINIQKYGKRHKFSHPKRCSASE